MFRLPQDSTWQYDYGEGTFAASGSWQQIIEPDPNRIYLVFSTIPGTAQVIISTAQGLYQGIALNQNSPRWEISHLWAGALAGQAFFGFAAPPSAVGYAWVSLRRPIGPEPLRGVG